MTREMRMILALDEYDQQMANLFAEHEKRRKEIDKLTLCSNLLDNWQKSEYLELSKWNVEQENQIKRETVKKLIDIVEGRK